MRARPCLRWRAWTSCDIYAGANHQLCCAHALREMQAVTDLAPPGQWCCAAQAAEALTEMQTLVSEAIVNGHDGADAGALVELVTATGPQR